MSNSQRKIPERERLKLWVRAGGRCELCNRYLLEGEMSARELTFGQAAHIVGQQASEGSPRGLDDDLSAEDRDSADNLMLVCDDEHDELDKQGSRDAFDIEFLRMRKRMHEDRVHLQTSMGAMDGTAAIRMIDGLRARPTELSRQRVAEAVMYGAGRFPHFPASTRHTIEIDLRGLPGEAVGGPDYYEVATKKIDEVMDGKVAEAIATEDITHLSVFAIARLPLLVYLGAKLDDTVATDVYQRHRQTENWTWPDRDDEVAFQLDIPTPQPDTDEAVLVLNISGTIHADELPDAVHHLPAFNITVDCTPFNDVVSGPRVLQDFMQTCGQLIGAFEETHKHVRRLHVFPAIPLSLAVVLGRAFNPDVHPTIRIYDRVNHEYVAAMEVDPR